MATVAISPRVNSDEPVMESYADLVGGVCFKFNPSDCVTQQDRQTGGDLGSSDTKVEFVVAELAGPAPNVTKHPAVQLADTQVIQ